MNEANSVSGSSSGFRYRAHPTTYAGTRFRSRLEARWAAFFDECCWEWQYEPTDVQGWAPDFNLIGKNDVTPVEVKPIEWARDTCLTGDPMNRPDLAKVRATKGREVLILGAYPVINPYVADALSGWMDQLNGPFLGLLFRGPLGGENDPDGYGLNADGLFYGWDHAIIHEGNYPVFDFCGGWGSPMYRVHSNYEPSYEPRLVDRAAVQKAWANANAKTQWLGR